MNKQVYFLGLQGDLWSWLQNEKCYDQFAVLYDKEIGDKKTTDIAPHVGVYEFRKGQDPQLASANSERVVNILK